MAIFVSSINFNMSLSLKFICLCILLILIGYAVFFFQKHGIQSSSTNIATQTEQEKMLKNTNALVTNVTFPKIPGNTKDVIFANVFIQGEIIKRIGAFEVDAQDSMKSAVDLSKDIKSSITGSPSIEEKNDRYVAIFMGIEWYLRGSAHPSHTIDTYIYDYQQKKLVEASQLFVRGSDYLKTLSRLSKEGLLAQSKKGDMGYVYDESMVTDGTAPQQENFSKILPLKDGLVVYFDEYQVAPYAAGPQQVIIPYSKLKGIIDPHGPLSRYMK